MHICPTECPCQVSDTADATADPAAAAAATLIPSDAAIAAASPLTVAAAAAVIWPRPLGSPPSVMQGSCPCAGFACRCSLNSVTEQLTQAEQAGVRFADRTERVAEHASVVALEVRSRRVLNNAEHAPAAAQACFLYQGVSPSCFCSHCSLFHCSVCQSSPIMPPVSPPAAAQTATGTQVRQQQCLEAR